MKLKSPIRLGIDRRELQGSVSFKLRPAAEALEELALGLTMLREGLLPRLRLIDQEANFSFAVELMDSPGQSEIEIGSSVALRLTPMDLSVWQHFVLKFVRDQDSDVDHVDTDALLSPGLEKEVTVTLTMPWARPGVSVKEAHPRPGL